MVEQTTHTRDAIALILQITDVDQLDQILAVATERRFALSGAPNIPKPPARIVLKQSPAWVTAGDCVRVNSPKNYSFHGLVGRVTKTTNRGQQPKVHILLDDGQKRTGLIRVPLPLLEVLAPL